MKFISDFFDLNRHIDKKATFSDYVKSALIATVAACIVFGIELLTTENFSNITSILILSVLYSAIYFGTGPAILNALFCSFLFDFFFVPPFLSPTNNTDNFIKFISFVFAALITSWIAGQARSYAKSMREKEKRISLIHTLSESLAEIMDSRKIAESATQIINQNLGLSVVILQGAEQRFIPSAGYEDIAIRSGNKLYGLLRVAVADLRKVDNYPSGILPALATQIALNMERLELREEKENALLEKERESLRVALLSSVSHDLKTPLASIIGAATSLEGGNSNLPEKDKKILVETIYTEAVRMSRFVSNLLEIARLESTGTLPRKTPVSIDDALDLAIKKLKSLLAGHTLSVDIPADLPLLKSDINLLEVVFTNLLENAMKFSSPESTIEVTASADNEQLLITIADNGFGIPEADLEKVFDKFYRVSFRDSTIAGTGLGLSICQHIVKAHNGSIRATSRNGDQGTIIEMRFPISETISEKNLPAGIENIGEAA